MVKIGLSIVVGIFIGILANALSTWWMPFFERYRRFVIIVFVVLITVLIGLSLPNPQTSADREWNLVPGQTLYISSGSLEFEDYQCGGSADRICILLFESTQVQKVQIRGLPILVSSEGTLQPLYYAGIRETSALEILEEQKANFWQPNNCITGCKEAKVLIVKNNVREPELLITPEPQ